MLHGGLGIRNIQNQDMICIAYTIYHPDLLPDVSERNSDLHMDKIE